MVPSAGTLGYVFEAFDLKGSRRVAVKRVRKAKRRISREYEILSAVKGNTRCVQLLDIFYTLSEDQKLTQNFVFELVPNSLEKLINSCKKTEVIPTSTIRRIMKQLMEGLSFIHSKKICHRDLKPDNVLLDEGKNVKICDFGSSKAMEKGGRHIPHIVNKYYRAPELLCCRADYDFAIDVWAAGCILVEMFTKEVLFPGKSEGLQMLEIIAILGTPPREAQEYLYANLGASAREMLESVEEFKAISLKRVFPKRYAKEDVAQAADLAAKMLAWHPARRVTAKEALKHPFLQVSST